jgi:hypothetical protein
MMTPAEPQQEHRWLQQFVGESTSAADPGRLERVALDEFFDGYPASRLIFDVLRAAVEEIGPTELRVTRSQVAFRRRRAFAWAWTPDRHLGPGHAPLVLTLSFRERDDSPRWKQIVEPYPGRFTHHLELHAAADIDHEVRGWLREAWEAAA